jgi:hypothetical protein
MPTRGVRIARNFGEVGLTLGRGGLAGGRSISERGLRPTRGRRRPVGRLRRRCDEVGTRRRWIRSVARAVLDLATCQSRHTATTVTFDSSVLFSDRVG